MVMFLYQHFGLRHSFFVTLLLFRKNKDNAVYERRMVKCGETLPPKRLVLIREKLFSRFRLHAAAAAGG